jgi:hypothetical protein
MAHPSHNPFAIPSWNQIIEEIQDPRTRGALNLLYPEHRQFYRSIPYWNYKQHVIPYINRAILHYNHAHPQQHFVDLGIHQKETIVNNAFTEFLDDIDEMLEGKPIVPAAAIGGTVEQFHRRIIDARKRRH